MSSIAFRLSIDEAQGRDERCHGITPRVNATGLIMRNQPLRVVTWLGEIGASPTVAAVLLDQRRSRTRPDLVDAWLDEMRADAALQFVLPFERTAGDEVEGLIREAETLATVTLRALEDSEWWVGIGIGEVEMPLPSSVRASRGPAFVLARRALEVAKRGRVGRLRVLAHGLDPRNLEAALLLMKTLFDSRTQSPNAESVAKMRTAGLSQALIAKTLGTTRQNVSQQLRAARWMEEQAGRRLVVSLSESLVSQLGRDGRSP
jgi:hypothetical protein